MTVDNQTLEARVGRLEDHMQGVREDVATVKSELNTDVAEIRKDMKELRDLLAGRPTWGVCMIIAGLSFTSAAFGSTLLTLLVNAN